MKAFAYILLMLVAIFVQRAAANKGYPEKCAHCFVTPFQPVCARRVGTYWNMCALKCDNAQFLHHGYCTYQDLLENENIENIY